MKICNTYSDVNTPVTATIGFFDGVHLGHQYLIQQMMTAADERKTASMVVTFPVHPRKVLGSDFQPQLLTTKEEKCELLEQTGVDYCLMLDFTPQIASLTARQFMAMLKEQCHVDVLVIGYDHRFGHNRSEGFEDYCRYGKELGIEVLKAEPYVLPDGRSVSSSMIRNILLQGDVSEANICLGYNYTLSGTVINGFHKGRTLGFPTANICLGNTDKLLPQDGVYAVTVDIDGHESGGMLNIGCRPTMNNGSERSVEVHVFGLHADLYAKHMRVSLVKRTRNEVKFNTPEELTKQLHRDAIQIKLMLGARLA